MPMTRPNALSYLIGQYATGPDPLQAATGTTPDDTDTGYGPAIDEALLALGTDYDALPVATVDNSKVGTFRAMLRFQALALFARRVTTDKNYNPGAGGATTINKGITLQQIREDMEREAGLLRGYGITVSVPATFRPAVISELSADIYN